MARSQGTVDSVAKKIQGAARTALLQTNELLRDRARTEKADSCGPDDDLPRQRATAPQFATRAVCQKLAKSVLVKPPALTELRDIMGSLVISALSHLQPHRQTGEHSIRTISVS